LFDAELFCTILGQTHRKLVQFGGDIVLNNKLMNLVGWLVSAALGAGSSSAFAQDSVRFLNDWRWEGPASPLAVAMQGGFTKAKLDVAVTPGTGSAATVQKVASGEFDIGLGDFSALVEFAARNPNVATPVAVYVLYERTPAALFVRSNFDLKSIHGKSIAAPTFDGGRKLWPAFAKSEDINAVAWQNVDALAREKNFAAGQYDAITGFYFTTMLNLEREGMSGTLYKVYPFYESGVRLYGNVLMVNPKFMAANPKAVKSFVRAYHDAVKLALKDTEAAIEILREVEPKIDPKLEWRRARLAFDRFVDTPTVRTTGLGTIDMARVQAGIDLVADAFKLPAKPVAANIATTEFLPPRSERALR
jgi:NitT/TauT family transport system substrate-binding protein